MDTDIPDTNALRADLMRQSEFTQELQALQGTISKNRVALHNRAEAGETQHPFEDYCLLRYGIDNHAIERVHMVHDLYEAFRGRTVLFVQTTYKRPAWPADPEGYDSRLVKVKNEKLVRFVKLTIGVSAGNIVPVFGVEDTLLFCTKGKAFTWNEFPSKRLNVTDEEGVEIETIIDIASDWAPSGIGVTPTMAGRCAQGELQSLYDILIGKYEIRRWAQNNAEYSEMVDLLLAKM